MKEKDFWYVDCVVGSQSVPVPLLSWVFLASSYPAGITQALFLHTSSCGLRNMCLIQPHFLFLTPFVASICWYDSQSSDVDILLGQKTYRMILSLSLNSPSYYFANRVISPFSVSVPQQNRIFINYSSYYYICMVKARTFKFKLV